MSSYLCSLVVSFLTAVVIFKCLPLSRPLTLAGPAELISEKKAKAENVIFK
jgi:hypothetical protein